MPWIEETIEHQHLLDELWWNVLRRFEDENGNKWWADMNDSVETVNLYKVVFKRGAFVPDGSVFRPSPTSGDVEICITRHMIMRRWDRELLGIAQSTGPISVNMKTCPEDYHGMMNWLFEHFQESVDYSSLYAYSLENYVGSTHMVDSTGTVHPVTVMTMAVDQDLLRTSLDIEFHSEKEFQPDTNQSPIVTLALKEKVSKYTTVGGVSFKTDTNWWKDSLIRIRGFVDETSLFLTLQADTSPSWSDNNVPKIPLFFGNLLNNANERTEHVALFGGTRVPWDFDYDDVENKVSVLQPISKNYVNYPSSGLDSIMLKKSKYGARYQEHFLRWNAPPNETPPPREIHREGDTTARKYPRAWNYQRKGYSEYDFHPSKYSDKLHVSKAYVIHPEDGVVGQIPHILLSPLQGLTDGDELELPLFCAECEEDQNYRPEKPTRETSGKWTTPFIGIADEVDGLVEGCSDDIFFTADTVEEAERFAISCLNIIPVYYSRSLEWANYVNRGIWEMVQRYPSLKVAFATHEVAVALDNHPETPNSLGYFINPNSSEDVMTLGIVTNRSVSEHEEIIRALFEAGFLSTPDRYHLITHELGHFLHYANVSLPRWRQLNEVDEDGYGPRTPLTSEETEGVEGSVSGYATVFYPLEYVAEVFALFALGYRVDQAWMEMYNEHGGMIPEELHVEEISERDKRPH